MAWRELQELFAHLQSEESMTGVELIAQERNGMLIGTEAVPIMIRAGIVRNTKAGTARFYNAVARYPHLFERISRGRYQLIG